MVQKFGVYGMYDHTLHILTLMLADIKIRPELSLCNLIKKVFDFFGYKVVEFRSVQSGYPKLTDRTDRISGYPGNLSGYPLDLSRYPSDIRRIYLDIRSRYPDI